MDFLISYFKGQWKKTLILMKESGETSKELAL